MKVIVDTSVLLRNFGYVESLGEGVEVIIPQAVFEEIESKDLEKLKRVKNFRSYSARKKCSTIRRALKTFPKLAEKVLKGEWRLKSCDQNWYDYVEKKVGGELSPIDKAVLATCLGENKLALLTLDKRMIFWAKIMNIFCPRFSRGQFEIKKEEK